MQIEISDRRLLEIITNNKLLIKKIGIELSKALIKRLNQIKASNNFKEYLDMGIGTPHLLVGNLKNNYGIRLNKNYRLVIEPLCERIDSETLKKCNKINVKGVVDYHDGKCEWLIP